MSVGTYSPHKGGIFSVYFPTEIREVPDSVDFHFSSNVVNVNFWLFQLIRRAIVEIWIDDGEGHYKEDKIRTIKAVRLVWNVGLKEAKDIVEWFFANVSRETDGIPL